jgi:hypothetical protein
MEIRVLRAGDDRLVAAASHLSTNQPPQRRRQVVEVWTF